MAGATEQTADGRQSSNFNYEESANMGVVKGREEKSHVESPCGRTGPSGSWTTRPGGEGDFETNY